MTVFSQRWIAVAATACVLFGCGGGSDSGQGSSTAGTGTQGGAVGGATGATNGSQTGGTSGGNTSGGTPSINPQGTSWTSVKWGGGGYVTGLIYHPTNASLLYARTDVGGAYRWNADNSTWTPITDGIGFGAGEGDFHGIESLALDPNNDQLVYMMAGITVTQGHNGRIYISGDRGNTWTHYDVPFPVGGNDNGRGTGERLQVDPNNPSTLFFGSRTAGLWKSTDSGRTWAQVTGLSSTTISGGNSPIGVEQVIFDTSGKGSGQPTWILWATIAPDYANAAGLTSTLYKSTNGGASWAPVAVPSTVSGYYIPHVVRTSDGNFYVVFNAGVGQGIGGPSYLYKFGGSNNSTWTQLKSSTSNGFGGLSVSGLGASARIALGMTGWSDTSKIVQLSDDGGNTWREIEAGMPHTGTASGGCAGWVEGVTIDPANRDHVMHVHGGGICETMNASSATPTWGPKVDNLEETATLFAATPPAGAQYTLINAAGDIGAWVITDLATRPTRTPMPRWSSGNAADMAWADPSYIAVTGVDNANGAVVKGFWSGDSGNSWSLFSSMPTGGSTSSSQVQSLAVTSRNNLVWAPQDSVPSYTTNNGASWTQTNLPAFTATWNGFFRAYRLAVDRKNPNKVYAFDSGGANWSGQRGKVYVSTDAGHTFTLSQGSVNASLAWNAWGDTSMAVNPNAEGDIWVADGNAVYHSLDSGATWTKLTAFATANGKLGATNITLGKAQTGSPYSAAVYVEGTINGQWGIFRSDDGGAAWSRFNDDAHQFGGNAVMAGDWNTYGRIYVNGAARGLIYSN
ncbi:dockerin [Ralstonia insidiosa]|jgi:xyloglucan-specific exo-beta-1,4-glucanase|uniref:dockerin n=1 Tax=Ralstonia TaxID=48736 RepID=UPI0006649DA9|nr:dockerin [Ralstonia insidiosa]KMW47362.1 dockerin [Ralstonia sp. MD27]MBX3773602.1 dockerin [Ralstonia pickettii]NOZ15277.1 dockerin [Betaproteobacteria bacterium]MBA9857616.1 dockerin [Ralstonia insidiosa]MBA9870947.1 dockerin [Ralstonia insidiosa]